MRGFAFRSLLLSSALLAVPAVAPAQEGSPVEGAWVITGSESAEGVVKESAQPGLYIFTGTHYSTMFVSADEPRQDLPEEPTDAETAAAYNPFIANSGRYEISGDEITTRAYVAKFPAYMHRWPDNASTYKFAVDGDEMVLTFRNGAKFMLERVEGMPMPTDE